MHSRLPLQQQPCGQRELPPCGERQLQPCGDFADRLVDLSDGELSAAEATIVREHCETCSDCRLTLARLDRSLGVLERALVACEPVAEHPVQLPTEQLGKDADSRPAAVRRIWAVALAASAVVAALLLAGIWLNQNPGGSGHGEPGVPQVAGSPPINDVLPVEQPEPVGRVQITPEMIARRLALIEQVARLEASLAMTPDDPWFASQRASNQRLLAGFRQAVEELSPAADNSQHSPSRKSEAL